MFLRLLSGLVILLAVWSCDVAAAQPAVTTEAPRDLYAISGDERPDSHSVPPINRSMVGLLFVYCTIIVTASVLGGWLPSYVELTHTRMQTIISFVGGLMLGIGVFHLLPHSTHALPTVDAAARWLMGGMLAMFFLIRAFHFHHHGPLEISPSDEGDVGVPPNGLTLAPQSQHSTQPCGHDHDHDHDHSLDHGSDRTGGTVRQLPHESGRHDRTTAGSAVAGPPCRHAHQLSWVGIAVGLSLHTLIDGVALAASVQAESAHRALWSLFGLGTFLAVVLHKPLDAVSITSLMAVSGWSRRSQSVVNAGFALMCPVGAVIYLLGVTQLQGVQQQLVGAALAFSAGVFICISLSDLLPEMEFHAHNRGRLTTALLAGIALAWAITFLEPSHLH